MAKAVAQPRHLPMRQASWDFSTFERRSLHLRMGIQNQTNSLEQSIQDKVGSLVTDGWHGLSF